MKTDILLVYYQDLALTSRLLDFDESHQLETKTVAEFYSGELSPDKKYEQITFFTHGSYLGRGEDDKPTNRSVHQSLLDEDGDVQINTQTLSLLKKGAKNTDKIFIESCFCGAVLKDLKDEESLSNIEIVVSSGSKYQSISHKLHFGLEKEFLKNGTDNLFEYATLNFPGTIGIKNKDGAILKLSSIKAEQNDSGEIILKRHLSSPNPEDSGKWWLRDRSITIDPADLTQNVKDVALIDEVIKNHEDKARLWQRLGANVNSKVLEDPITLLLAATQSGYSQSVGLLLRMDEIDTTIEQDLSNNLILNAAISLDKDPVLKLLISQLPPEHITQSCKVLEKVSKEFSGQLDHKIRIIAESLLPYTIEANNDNATTILLNTPGINRNEANQDGYTPLILAAKNSNEDITKKLLHLLDIKEIDQNVNFIVNNNMKETGLFLLNVIREEETTKTEPKTSCYARENNLKSSVRKLEKAINGPTSSTCIIQ